MMMLKGPDQQVRAAPPALTWRDASQHPSGIWSAAFFFAQFFPKAHQTQRMGITYRHKDPTARRVSEACGLLHCFCVKYLWL